MTAPPVAYKNLMQDNARWESIELREGDIIVSTPAKCGTTWMQIICGLLVFGRPELPTALDDLSQWPDAYFHTIDDLKSMLEAQDHRRFMKTHTPLDGLPWDERVTYVSIGRDPRDVGISLDNHLANTDWERVTAIRESIMGPDGADFAAALPQPAPTLYERFWNWTESDDFLFSLQALTKHIEGFWERREAPNTVLLHYDDLKADLDGQMRGLADVLGIDLPEDVWPELVRAATFDQVRLKADTLAPEGRIWKDRTEFFHKGSSGQWRELLDEADLDRYRGRVAELTDPEIAEWLHRGPI